MLKVLVVDDEAPIRRWLEYCIDQFDGFTVAGVAASGTEGLEIYRRERPNIVVSDIEMPGMDGLEMLRRMQKIHPAYMIILTSHEKFSYARQALNLGTAEYILKAEITMQSFQTVLLKAADTIRGRGVSDTGDAEQAARRFLKQLLADGWPGEEADIGGMLQRYGIRLRQKPFFAADILSRDGTELRALRRMAQDAPGLENLSMFPLDYDHLLIIANLGQEGGYPSVVQYFESKNHLSFIVGFSDPVRKLSELPETLRTAKARCNLHFYHPDRRVFWKETVGVLAPRHTEIWKASFSKALFGQNYREAAVIKDQAVQELLDDCPTDLDAVKELCGFFVSTLLYLTGEQDDKDEERLEEARRTVSESRSMEELLDFLDQIFRPFASGLPRPGSYSEPIREAVAYMKAHYAEKITLSMVAGKVSFNPEYFSRMFMKETGLNFVTYLNNLRMRQAVELLEWTNKKIYEIAEEVGYSSVSYFSTAFKKTFGQTPNEYQIHIRRHKHDDGLAAEKRS